MAEVTAMRNNALPYPIYGVPWVVTFPILDADGDLVTGATTPDAEVSKNGDTFADCTNESTEIATNSGVYYLILTGAEMTADIVTVIAKSATAGAKTTTLSLYPRKLVALRAGTAAGGAAGSITLDSGAGALDDKWNGCVVVGVLDSATEARVITDYTGSTKVAAVTPDWNTTPDSDDTFTIYLPEGRQIPTPAVHAWVDTAAVAGAVPAVIAGGSGGLLISGSNTGTTTLGAFTVTGATTLSTLTASGAVAFQSTFAVTTSTSLGALSCSTLTASGAVAFQSTFAVTTSTALGALSCSTLTASGAVAFQSTFAVTTSTSLAAVSATTITASGTTSLAAVTTSGTVTMNALTVSNATTLTGAVSATNASNDIRGILLQATQSGVTIPTVTTVTNQLTAAQIATGVWQDATAGDFTTASSIGKSLYTSGVVPGGSGGLFIAGTNAATVVTTSFTTTFTGNLTGSVASVSGAVGSVTGAVGSIATGGIAAASFAAGAIDAAALAADAGTEIGTAVWATATRVLTAATNITAGITTAVLTTQMTESYRSAGTAPTLAQSQFELIGGLLDHSISSTTKTIRNIAGTAAKTYTLDSASAPTSITEAT